MSSNRAKIEQSWFDMLKMEALKRYDSRLTYQQMADILKCSKMKVSSAYSHSKFLDIPDSFRKEHQAVAEQEIKKLMGVVCV